ncbi:MAG: hypothetical protein II527_04130 [Bacteroidales bacterium]|nr:hypothetical protein [Bacteroidales bacterium]MBQ2492499.1 hypothetical protein [Bacteroidales bacterium]MBQ4197386.1 hypothetical protein [Bacteroidales bacterium]
MKRYFKTLFILAALLSGLILLPAGLEAGASFQKPQAPDSLAGQKIFQAASEYVFSGRKLSVVITNLDKKGNAYYNRGFFVALPERGYMEIEGVSEFQFSPTLITSYSYQTNEYVVQPRKTTSSSISDNPFSILSKKDKGVSVSEPKEGDVRGVPCTKISVTPQGKAYYLRADVYVAGAVSANSKATRTEMKVLRITIVLKRDQAFVVDVVDAGPKEPEKVQDYRLLISDHPGAEMVDLRD